MLKEAAALHFRRVTIYLMNENELVQSAVAFGNTEDRICNVIPGFTEKVCSTAYNSYRLDAFSVRN